MVDDVTDLVDYEDSRVVLAAQVHKAGAQSEARYQ